MDKEFKARELDVANLLETVNEGYEVFASHRLRSDFASRCSPMADRPNIAARLQTAKHLSETQEVDMAVYIFKALYTMGDEKDLLYFLPRAFELASKGLVDKESEWYSHETILCKKIVMLKDQNMFTKNESEFIKKFLDKLWTVIVSTFPGSRWPPLDFLEDVKHIGPQERFLQQWLSSTAPGALTQLTHYATKEICYVKDPAMITWLQSEPVLEKVVPNL